MTTSLAAGRPSPLPAGLLLRWTGRKVLSAEADMFIGGMGVFHRSWGLSCLPFLLPLPLQAWICMGTRKPGELYLWGLKMQLPQCWGPGMG